MAAARGGVFADILKSSGDTRRKPPKVVTLPLDGWSDAERDKPSAPMPIGIRLPSPADDDRARDEAVKAVGRLPPGADEEDKILAFNNALIRERVAACTCLAEDVTQGFFEMAADEVMRRLSKSGLKRLWEEIEALQAGADVSLPELDVEGLAHLTAMLDRAVGFDHMPREDAKRLRRLLEHVRQELQVGEERAERAGVMVLESSERAPEPLRDDLGHVIAAMERRQAPGRLGAALK